MLSRDKYDHSQKETKNPKNAYHNIVLQAYSKTAEKLELINHRKFHNNVKLMTWCQCQDLCLDLSTTVCRLERVSLR